MSKLVPEKRLDKNGHLVTRHVRPADDPQPQNQPFPKPKATVRPNTSQSTISLSDKQTRVDNTILKESDYDSDQQLINVLGPASETSTKGWHTFSASDAEFFDVLSVTNIDNAVLLLNHNIRNSEEAVRVLNENSLGHLIQDNSSVTDEALRRRIPKGYCFEVHENRPLLFEENPDRFLDAAEAYSDKKLYNSYRQSPTFADMVRDGDIRLSDIKQIGVRKMIDACDDEGRLVQLLKDMASGESACTAQEVVRVINKYELTANRFKEALKQDVYGILNRHGADFIEQKCFTENPEESFLYARYMDELAMHAGRDKESARNLIEYGEELREAKASKLLDGEDYLPLMDAEVPPVEVARMLKDKMTAQQIIAVSNHDVPVSVSDGWL